MRTGIYCFENMQNGKKYVGQAVDIDRRWYEHEYYLLRGKDKCIALQRAVLKYGIDSFHMYVIEYCNSAELNDKEIFWINKFDTHNPKFGYNLSTGGNSGMVGYKHSEETKKKISESKKGWIMGEAQRRFISLLHTGKIVSAETRKKMSIANTKENHPMWGKKHTPETIKKYKEERSGDRAYQFGTKSENSTSKFFGVSRIISKGKYIYWVAYVKVVGVKNYIGSSKDEEETARMYDAYIIENGLPNPLNFPDEILKGL